MRVISLIAALTLTLLACDEHAGGPGAGSAQQEVGATGTLSLNLMGADDDGRVYRLRNATFHVQRLWSDFAAPDGGGFSATLTSESDVDAPALSVTLTPGYYDVTLANPDWYIERRSEGVWQRVAPAVLLSGSTQSAYVVDRGVSSVDFRFGVDGELIDFRAGDLRIGISIEKPGEAGPDGGWFGGTGGLTGGTGGATGGGWIDAGVAF